MIGPLSESKLYNLLRIASRIANRTEGVISHEDSPPSTPMTPKEQTEDAPAYQHLREIADYVEEYLPHANRSWAVRGIQAAADRLEQAEALLNTGGFWT